LHQQPEADRSLLLEKEFGLMLQSLMDFSSQDLNIKKETAYLLFFRYIFTNFSTELFVLKNPLPSQMTTFTLNQLTIAFAGDVLKALPQREKAHPFMQDLHFTLTHQPLLQCLRILHRFSLNLPNNEQSIKLFIQITYIFYRLQ
jgi:hypothetical protein